LAISSRLGSLERESLVGLLLSQAPDEASPKRLLAQVENVELLANRLVIELNSRESNADRKTKSKS
jgi:hypothetical protein